MKCVYYQHDEILAKIGNVVHSVYPGTFIQEGYYGRERLDLEQERDGDGPRPGPEGKRDSLVTP